MKGTIVNKKQLADIIGYSERSITEFQKDPNFPIKLKAGRGSSNQYNTSDVIKWFVQRELSGDKQESAQERLTRVRADREELGLAEDLKLLIPAKDLEKNLTAVFSAIKVALMNSMETIKSEIDVRYGIDVDFEILDEHSRQALTHLSAIKTDIEE